MVEEKGTGMEEVLQALPEEEKEVELLKDQGN